MVTSLIEKFLEGQYITEFLIVVGLMLVLLIALMIFIAIRRRKHRSKMQHQPQPIIKEIQETVIQASPLKFWRPKQNLPTDEELVRVNQELASIDSTIPQMRGRVITSYKRTHGEHQEKEESRYLLQEELENISKELRKKKTNQKAFLGFLKPKRKSQKQLEAEKIATEEVIKISKIVEGNNPMPENEIIHVSKELNVLKEKLEQS